MSSYRKTMRQVREEMLVISEAKYELYHKDFSGAMQHAYKMAKKLHGITIDPKEIDDKVATGPRKPSEGDTNKYRLKGDKGGIQVQVYNKGGSKPFELNFYKEEADLDEVSPNKPKSDVIVMKKGQVEKSVVGASAVKKAEKEGFKIQYALLKTGKKVTDPKGIMKAIKSADKLGIGEEVELDEAKMSSSQIAKLKKAYEPMRGKKISTDNANKLSAMMDKVGKDKEALIQLFKADIPFVSQSAVTKLISKHNMKGAEINKLKEEFNIESVDLDEYGGNFGGGPMRVEKGKKKKEGVDEGTKQILAHGGKGKYKVTKDGDTIEIKFGGKVVGTADFDRGADSFFVSIKGEKGQKSFDDAQAIADYFAKNKITEEVDLEEGKMSQLHQMIKDKKSAEEISKAMKVDVNTIKTLMANYSDMAASKMMASYESYDFLDDIDEETLSQIEGLLERNDTEELNELLGAIGRGIKKVATYGTTANRADRADKKVKKIEKKNADKERLMKAKDRLAQLRRPAPSNESYEMGTDEYRKHTQSITPGQEVTDYQNFKVESMKEALAKVWGLDEWKNTKENRRVDGGDKRRLENKVKSGKTITGKTSDVIDLKPTTEEKQLDDDMNSKEEEKMVTANYMIKSGKSAEDVAKVINVDVKEIKKVMSAYHDEQNSHYKEYLAAACSRDAMTAAGAMGA